MTELNRKANWTNAALNFTSKHPTSILPVSWATAFASFQLSQQAIFGRHVSDNRDSVFIYIALMYILASAIMYPRVMGWVCGKARKNGVGGRGVTLLCVAAGALTYVLPLELTFPGPFWLLGLFLPTAGMATFAIAYALGGAVYGLAYSLPHADR